MTSYNIYYHTKKWTINNYLKFLNQDGIMIIEDVRGEETEELLNHIPPTHKGEVIDLRSIKGRWDDILILITRK